MSIEGLTEEQFKILEPLMEKWVNRNHYGRKVAPWNPWSIRFSGFYAQELLGGLFHDNSLLPHLLQHMNGLEKCKKKGS